LAVAVRVGDESDGSADRLARQEKALIESLQLVAAGKHHNAEASSRTSQTKNFATSLMSRQSHTPLPASARAEMLAAMKSALEDMTKSDTASDPWVPDKAGGFAYQEDKAEKAASQTEQDRDHVIRLSEELEHVLKQGGDTHSGRERLPEATVESALQLTKELSGLLAKLEKAADEAEQSHDNGDERVVRHAAGSDDDTPQGQTSLKSQVSEKLMRMAQEAKSDKYTTDTAPSAGASAVSSQADYGNDVFNVAHKEEKEAEDKEGLITKLLGALDNIDGKNKPVPSSSHSEDSFANQFSSKQTQETASSGDDSDTKKQLIEQLQSIVSGIDKSHKAPGQNSESEMGQQKEEAEVRDKGAITPAQRKAAGLNAMRKLIMELQNIANRQR
jgi:hypothetical protein